VDDRFLISVQEAANRLGVSADAVRKRIVSGRLPAQRRGREWWLDAREIDRTARRRTGQGRPLSPQMAWAILLLASGDADAAARAIRNPRYRTRLHSWLRDHSLADHASRLRARADAEEFDAHASELARIVDRSDVLTTGISAADTVGLLGGSSAVEIYAPAAHRDAFIDEHALEPGPDRSASDGCATRSGRFSIKTTIAGRRGPQCSSTCSSTTTLALAVRLHAPLSHEPYRGRPRRRRISQGLEGGRRPR
jgi:excisionase family DNA binding protein